MRTKTVVLLTIVTLLGLCGFASANAVDRALDGAQTDPITGHWDVTFKLQDASATGTFDLKLEGSSVTGGADTHHTGPGVIREGAWKDGSISFTLDFKAHESIVVTGHLDGDKLVGEFSTEGMKGSWEAVRN